MQVQATAASAEGVSAVLLLPLDSSSHALLFCTPGCSSCPASSAKGGCSPFACHPPLTLPGGCGGSVYGAGAF